MQERISVDMKYHPEARVALQQEFLVPNIKFKRKKCGLV